MACQVSGATVLSARERPRSQAVPVGREHELNRGDGSPSAPDLTRDHV